MDPSCWWYKKKLTKHAIVVYFLGFRFELFVSTFLLYRLLGWSLVAGLAVFALLVPVQTMMGKFMSTFQDDQLKWMDERLRLMTEVLSNIKIVKLYNWYVDNSK